MWDERFSGDEYAYGTAPNEFLKENFDRIPMGNVLCIGEGEGRNAVFLAKQGYEVTAVDSSSVGLEKAKRLADENGVSIECVHADLAEFDLGVSNWEGIVSVFVPLPSEIRRALYDKAVIALKPGGAFLIEAYRPDQIEFGTGGGSSADTMQTKATIAEELAGLEFSHLTELERSLVEGSYHTGLGAVVQAIAVKGGPSE